MTNIRTSSLIKSTFNFKNGLYELDARVIPFEKASGKALQDIIMESVVAEHTSILHEFPSWLIVTEKQFASLNDYTDEMYTTTDRMFKVLDGNGKVLCIMEVNIDEAIDTVDEISEIKHESDEMLSTLDFSKLEGKVLTPDNFKGQI